MPMRHGRALATCALLVAAEQALTPAWSQSPELPVPTRERGQPQPVEGPVVVRPDADAALKSILAELGNREAVGGNFQAVCQTVEAFCEALANPGPSNSGSASMTLRFTPGLSWSFGASCYGERQANSSQARSAFRMFEIGRACEMRGDLAMAQNCYDEVTRMCPTSHYAAVARARLGEMLVARRPATREEGGYEEQEPTPKKESIGESRADLRRIQESRKMLKLGLKHQEAGELDEATRCYQEAHAICPACRHGQEAFAKMLQVEEIKGRHSKEGGAEEQEPPAERRLRMSSADFSRRQQAQAYFKLAERCYRGGDYRIAYGFYQEAHLACPDCYHGMQAIERMNDIEARTSRSPSGWFDWNGWK